MELPTARVNDHRIFQLSHQDVLTVFYAYLTLPSRNGSTTPNKSHRTCLYCSTQSYWSLLQCTADIATHTCPQGGGMSTKWISSEGALKTAEQSPSPPSLHVEMVDRTQNTHHWSILQSILQTARLTEGKHPREGD